MGSQNVLDPTSGYQIFLDLSGGGQQIFTSRWATCWRNFYPFLHSHYTSFFPHIYAICFPFSPSLGIINSIIVCLQVKVYKIIRYAFESACIQNCVWMNSCSNFWTILRRSKRFGPFLRGQNLFVSLSYLVPHPIFN